MSSKAMVADGEQPEARNIWTLPGSILGWSAVALTVLIVPVAWVLMSHAIPWPVLDTWVAPMILVVLIDAAAVAAFVSVVRQQERSILSIASLVVAVPLAVFATLMLIGEVVFPH